MRSRGCLRHAREFGWKPSPRGRGASAVCAVVLRTRPASACAPSVRARARRATDAGGARASNEPAPPKAASRAARERRRNDARAARERRRTCSREASRTEPRASGDLAACEHGQGGAPKSPSAARAAAREREVRGARWTHLKKRNSTRTTQIQKPYVRTRESSQGAMRMSN